MVELGDERVVVPHDGHVVGHPQSCRFEGAERAGGDEVVEGENGGGHRIGLGEVDDRGLSVCFVVATSQGSRFESERAHGLLVAVRPGA